MPYIFSFLMSISLFNILVILNNVISRSPGTLFGGFTSLDNSVSFFTTICILFFSISSFVGKGN